MASDASPARARVAHHPDEGVRHCRPGVERSGDPADAVPVTCRGCARRGLGVRVVFGTNRTPPPIETVARHRRPAGLVVRSHHLEPVSGRGRTPARGRRRRRRHGRHAAAADQPRRRAMAARPGASLWVRVAFEPPADSTRKRGRRVADRVAEEDGGRGAGALAGRSRVFGGGVDAGGERAERDTQIVVALGAAGNRPAPSPERGDDRDTSDFVDAPQRAARSAATDRSRRCRPRVACATHVRELGGGRKPSAPPSSASAKTAPTRPGSTRFPGP